MLSGIVHALQSGERWIDCTDVHGLKKTLYDRFVRLSERCIWENISSALAGSRDTPDRLFIDSSCLKVHRCAGGGNVWPAPSAGSFGDPVLGSLRQRIRSQGRTLAKMEIRASYAS